MRRKELPNFSQVPITYNSTNDSDIAIDSDKLPKFHTRPKVLAAIQENHNFSNIILNQRRFKGHPYLNLELYLKDIDYDAECISL